MTHPTNTPNPLPHHVNNTTTSNDGQRQLRQDRRLNPRLNPLSPSELHERRERVFLILAGLFLGTLAMLNILGISRFLDMSFEVFGMKIPFVLAVGVLPYPVTFLCTDFISELYGRRRANLLVWVGLMLNLWVVAFLWLGGIMPPISADWIQTPAYHTSANTAVSSSRYGY